MFEGQSQRRSFQWKIRRDVVWVTTPRRRNVGNKTCPNMPDGGLCSVGNCGNRNKRRSLVRRNQDKFFGSAIVGRISVLKSLSYFYKVVFQCPNAAVARITGNRMKSRNILC